MIDRDCPVAPLGRPPAEQEVPVARRARLECDLGTGKDPKGPAPQKASPTRSSVRELTEARPCRNTQTGCILPNMPADWLLPTAVTAYKNREQLQEWWQRFLDSTLGKRKTFAFTGDAGAGKTVLFDHLTGSDLNRGYHPPGASQQQESGRLDAEKRRIRLVTIPGQNSSPRFEAIESLFSDKYAVDGVIHVVAQGYVETRDETARRILIQDQGIDTLSKYREIKLRDELTDLEETCELIRRSLQKHRKPKWLLVAVTKLDLFYNDVAQARAYYSPHNPDSPFSQTLTRLRRQVGEDNFRWDAAPVCCRPESFNWNLETVRPVLTIAQRDHYLASFAEALKEMH